MLLYGPIITIPSDPQLEQLSQADLIVLVRALLARVESLEKEVRDLRDENERLKRPKANSQNSSQPPSRDQKPNAPSGKQKRKHGPPFGHNRFVRKLVDNPDRVIRVDVNQCESCHCDLSATEPSKVIRRQITELPEIKPKKLLTFLDYPGVPPTNNASEQAIRTSVIHRKGTKNGFRSEWGAKAYADLLSVISTSKIKGQGVLTTLVNLMGPEVLPFLHA